jgi:hypothetical protein
MARIMPIQSNPFTDTINNSFNVYVNTKLAKNNKIHVSILGCSNTAVILVPVPVGTSYGAMQEDIVEPIIIGVSAEPSFYGINNELTRADMSIIGSAHDDVIIIWEMDKSLHLDRSFEIFHAKGLRSFSVSELCEGQDNIRINISENARGIKISPYMI